MNRDRAHIALLRRSLLVLAATMLLAACKPSVPDTYLQPDEMADVLYDYHLAEAVARQQYGDDKYAPLAFKTSILKKHGISEAEFDSSMVYYTRHTRYLHDVYETLADRLGDEALAQGSTVGELNKYGSITSSADTADVWNGDRVIIMSPYSSFNTYSFEVKVDTAFHQGDKLLLDFDTQFLYQDGVRDAVAVLAITFTNDSVASQATRLTSTSHYHLQLGSDSLAMKQVRGYFLLNKKPSTESATTLKMLLISGIKLVRMHNMAQTIAPETNDNKTPAVDSTNRTLPQEAQPIKNTSGSTPMPMPAKAVGAPPALNIKKATHATP